MKGYYVDEDASEEFMDAKTIRYQDGSRLVDRPIPAPKPKPEAKQQPPK